MSSRTYLRGEILRVEYPDGDWFIGEVINNFDAGGWLMRDVETGKHWPAFTSTKITKLLRA